MTYTTQVTALSPAVFWKLSDGVGVSSIIDSSGNGNTGVITRTAASLFAPGGLDLNAGPMLEEFTKSVGFNTCYLGNNNLGHVRASGISYGAGTGLTVMGWYQDVSASDYLVDMFQSTQADLMRIQVKSPYQVVVEVHNSLLTFTTTQPVITGEPTHIALTWNQSDGAVELIVNGVLEGTGTLAAAASVDSTFGMGLGSNYNTSGTASGANGGYRQAWSVHTSALTASQVLTAYSDGVRTTPESLSQSLLPISANTDQYTLGSSDFLSGGTYELTFDLVTLYAIFSTVDTDLDNLKLYLRDTTGEEYLFYDHATDTSYGPCTVIRTGPAFGQYAYTVAPTTTFPPGTFDIIMRSQVPGSTISTETILPYTSNVSSITHTFTMSDIYDVTLLHGQTHYTVVTRHAQLPGSADGNSVDFQVELDLLTPETSYVAVSNTASTQADVTYAKTVENGIVVGFEPHPTTPGEYYMKVTTNGVAADGYSFRVTATATSTVTDWLGVESEITVTDTAVVTVDATGPVYPPHMTP